MAQNKYGMRASPKNVDIQFKDMLKIEDRGSKLENRLVIIFSLVFL